MHSDRRSRRRIGRARKLDGLHEAPAWSHMCVAGIISQNNRYIPSARWSSNSRPPLGELSQPIPHSRRSMTTGYLVPRRPHDTLHILQKRRPRSRNRSPATCTTSRSFENDLRFFFRCYASVRGRYRQSHESLYKPAYLTDTPFPNTSTLCLIYKFNIHVRIQRNVIASS